MLFNRGTLKCAILWHDSSVELSPSGTLKRAIFVAHFNVPLVENSLKFEF